jgi:hypothetical protein
VRPALAAVAAAIIAFVSGCGGQLEAAKTAGTIINQTVVAQEMELTLVCNKADQNIIDEFDPGPEREDRRAVVNAKCLAAWELFDVFVADWHAFERAVAIAEIEPTTFPEVLRALQKVLTSEYAFQAAVAEVLGEVGGEQN